ncbi:MAG: diacylglycerol/lipid kinase family protein [Syntrophothermus sp.]
MELTDKWLVIVNPNAGVQKGLRDWPRILEILRREGLNFFHVITLHRDHANHLTVKYIAEGYRNIIVAGGDGTMNEVVNGIFTQITCSPHEITLGMIPVGTGNDWCRTFSIPFNYEEAIQILKRKTTVLQDTGKISFFRKEEHKTRYFMNIAGMGYDALVAKKTNLLKERGRGGPFTYFYFVFSSLFQFKFPEAIVEVDDEQVFKGEIFSMNVGICKYNGGGMMQVPFAVPDDGLFDVTVIRKAPKWMVVLYARKLYDGSLVNLDFVKTFRGKSIRVRSTAKIFLEADGESLGHSPFVYEILPRTLKVITGQNL